MIAGGWQAADPKTKHIRAAAEFAAALVPPGHGALADVSSTQTQIVAGTNIRMVLRFADGSRWQATVWHKLDDTFTLTETVPLP